MLVTLMYAQHKKFVNENSIVIEGSGPFFLRTEKTQQKTTKPFKAAKKQLQIKQKALTIAQKWL